MAESVASAAGREMAESVASAAGRGAKGTPPVLLVTHAACSQHDIEDHPEQPARLSSIVSAVEDAFGHDASLLAVNRNPRAATAAELQYFHTRKHVQKVQTACKRAETVYAKALKKHGSETLLKKHRTVSSLEVEIDGDTSVMRHSGAASVRAAGAVIVAVDGVLSGAASSAFCAVRPPGHHAEPSAPMGFCLFGNAGIGAHHARKAHGLQRIACVDWDVHHGNGTQAGFEKDPDLFFGSSHQMPCYPGTGHPSEKGVAGNVVNVGLKPGSGSEAFREAWSGAILPALRAFRPELILVSAGFDAHADDPLANVNLTDEDYHWVQREVMAVARDVCGGRVVSVLEGGYDLDAIARSAVQCVKAQIEEVRPELQQLQGGGGGGGGGAAEEGADVMVPRKEDEDEAAAAEAQQRAAAAVAAVEEEEEEEEAEAGTRTTTTVLAASVEAADARTRASGEEGKVGDDERDGGDDAAADELSKALKNVELGGEEDK